MEDVTLVNAINNPGADIDINQVNSTTVNINVTFSNLRNAQIVTFDVATNAEALIVLAEASDFNAHTTSLPEGQSGGTDHGGQIIDIAQCQ